MCFRAVPRHSLDDGMIFPASHIGSTRYINDPLWGGVPDPPDWLHSTAEPAHVVSFPPTEPCRWPLHASTPFNAQLSNHTG